MSARSLPFPSTNGRRRRCMPDASVGCRGPGRDVVAMVRRAIVAVKSITPDTHSSDHRTRGDSCKRRTSDRKLSIKVTLFKEAAPWPPTGGAGATTARLVSSRRSVRLEHDLHARRYHRVAFPRSLHEGPSSPRRLATVKVDGRRRKVCRRNPSPDLKFSIAACASMSSCASVFTVSSTDEGRFAPASP